LLVILARTLEPPNDQLQFCLWCRNAAPGILLEGVQHIDGSSKPYGVYGAERVVIEIVGTPKWQAINLYVQMQQARNIMNDPMSPCDF